MEETLFAMISSISIASGADPLMTKYVELERVYCTPKIWPPINSHTERTEPAERGKINSLIFRKRSDVITKIQNSLLVEMLTYFI